jgi:putative FmdB family regulatory protein
MGDGMPVYDYECHACGKKFTETMPISKAGGHVRCPNCGSDNTAQRIEAAFVATSRKS